MHAMILAAGFGSRLGELFGSKPLAAVRGVTLIEIAIRQCMRAGVTHVVVVTGHKAAELERELAALSERLNIAITPVRLDDWSVPNGYSVMAGARAISGDFLLMMADHILSDGILGALAAQDMDESDVILAIDRRLDNPLVDPEDATWVSTCADGTIEQIGKTIVDFDAVDCGAFLANAQLPAAIAEAIASGLPGGLSDGMQVLADRGRAGTLDIGDAWWIDVDDPRAHALAEAQVGEHLSGFVEEQKASSSLSAKCGAT